MVRKGIKMEGRKEEEDYKNKKEKQKVFNFVYHLYFLQIEQLEENYNFHQQLWEGKQTAVFI